jgi:uncharacterized membrane protein
MKTVGRLLAAGVNLSAICLGLGLILTYADYALGPEPATPHVLLHAGIVLLMATPLVRVLVSLAGEIRQRNWFFVWITLAVLGVLAATLITSLGPA